MCLLAPASKHGFAPERLPLTAPRPQPPTPTKQENIICVRKPREVQHPLVAQLFVGFSPEDGYLPGPLLRERYPADF